MLKIYRCWRKVYSEKWQRVVIGSPSIKYLGVHIDKNLNFSAHIKYATNKTKVAGHLLFPAINNKSPLSIQTKLYIYKTYILTYASPAWASNISNSNEAVQSNTLHRITNLPLYVCNHYIRKSTNIPSIADYINSTSFQLKTQSSLLPSLTSSPSQPAPHFSTVPKATVHYTSKNVFLHNLRTP